MSLTAEYVTEIVVPQPELIKLRANIKESPCLQILRLAMEKIAQERRGILADGYHDCNGQFHPCLLALRTPETPQGIGVNVASDGRVVFHFDQRVSAPGVSRAIGDDIARAYAVIAVMRAQKQLGHQVTIMREDATATGKSVCIKGIRL